jgi:hypothetical protein
MVLQDLADGERAELEPRLAAVEQAGELREALMGERTFGVTCVQGVLTGELAPAEVDLPRGFSRPYLLHDACAYLDLCERTLVLCELPYHEARPGLVELETELTRWPWLHPLASGFVTPLRRVVEREALALMQCQLARLALAAQEYRQMEGEWPGSVADLAPLFTDGVPVCPLTGQSFRLRAADSGIQLYSPALDVPPDPDYSLNVNEERLTWELP